MAEYMLFLLLRAHNIQTTQNTQLSSQRKKEKTKGRKKKVFRVSNFFFFEKEETHQRDESTLLSFHARALYSTLAPSLQNRRNARVIMSAGMPYGLQAMLKVRKNAFSLFLSHVYVLFDACFYDNERERCVFVFSNDERGLPPSSKEKLSISALTSLSDLMIFFSKR